MGVGCCVICKRPSSLYWRWMIGSDYVLFCSDSVTSAFSSKLVIKQNLIIKKIFIKKKRRREEKRSVWKNWSVTASAAIDDIHIHATVH